MVRFKNRYLLVEITSPNEESISQMDLNGTTVLNAIKDSILSNYGDLGLAKLILSLQVKYINMKSRIMIIRAAREYIGMVWGSIIFITSLQAKKIRLRVLHCSGTIKKIEIKAKDLMIKWLNKILKNDELTMLLKAQMINQLETDLLELNKIEQNCIYKKIITSQCA